jgi:hypothetical protein
MSNKKQEAQKEIDKLKIKLISIAKNKGLYENFGKKEVISLTNKYGYIEEVYQFDNWCMNVSLQEIGGKQ